VHTLAGSWVANIEKSQRHVNHQFQQATMRFDINGDRVSLTYGGINHSGREEHGHQVFLADGADHPVPGAPGIVSTSTLGPNAFQSTGKKDGTVVGHAVYEVSDDGRSMTATVSGIDGSGKPFDQVIVFDRE
jgi:hypothetical protein